MDVFYYDDIIIRMSEQVGMGMHFWIDKFSRAVQQTHDNKDRKVD